MINFGICNLSEFWEECDSIFEDFVVRKMPSECYGYRTFQIETAFAKHSNNQLEWVDGKGYDFISGNLKYEFKQVQDAFKKNFTPIITLKNFRKKCLGELEHTFDYLIVIDVTRRALAIFDWDYVNSQHTVNDATITASLELSKAVEIKTLYHEII